MAVTVPVKPPLAAECASSSQLSPGGRRKKKEEVGEGRGGGLFSAGTFLAASKKFNHRAPHRRCSPASPRWRYADLCARSPPPLGNTSPSSSPNASARAPAPGRRDTVTPSRSGGAGGAGGRLFRYQHRTGEELTPVGLPVPATGSGGGGIGGGEEGV